jgi:hypothetical protein
LLVPIANLFQALAEFDKLGVVFVLAQPGNDLDLDLACTLRIGVLQQIGLST